LFGERVRPLSFFIGNVLSGYFYGVPEESTPLPESAIAK
jgi:hypothetical protein